MLDFADAEGEYRADCAYRYQAKLKTAPLATQAITTAVCDSVAPVLWLVSTRGSLPRSMQCA